MNHGDKPIANPFVILREEFDDWAILFNPDTGRGFGLSPTGVYVWKLLDGEHTIDEMLAALRRDALDVPESIHDDVGAFVDALVAEGLTGFQSSESGPLADAQRRAPGLGKWSSPAEEQSGEKHLTYELPALIDFQGGRAVGVDCTSHGSQGGSCWWSGLGAADCCMSTGGCATETAHNCTCFGSCVELGNCNSGNTVQYFCQGGSIACNWCSTGGSTGSGDCGAGTSA